MADAQEATGVAGEAEEAKEAVSGQAQDAIGKDGLLGELGSVVREAAMSVLKPAMKSASESAAQYAVSKGPDLLKSKVMPKIEEAGGVESLANEALKRSGSLPGKMAGKLGIGSKLAGGLLPGGGDDDEEDGDGAPDLDATGSGRRMPIQQSVDIAAPLEQVYDHWTQFEEYPQFMHRVDSASQEDDTHVTFTEKLWGFSRDFEAEIVDQQPNERIVWRSVNGLKHVGVVTFHSLAPRLTRVEVTVDFQPEGFLEKVARGARFSKRAVRADLHRFKAYVEMQPEDADGWHGRIEDAEVVESPEEHEQAQAEGEEPEAEEEAEEPEAEEEGEEPEAEEEAEEPEAEEEAEEPEAEEEGEEPEAEEEGEEPEAEEEAEEPEAEEEAEEPEAEQKAKQQPKRQQQRRRQPAQASKATGQRRRQGQPAQSSRGGGRRQAPTKPTAPRRRSGDGDTGARPARRRRQAAK